MQRTIFKKSMGVLSLSLCLQMPPAFAALRAALSAIFRGFSTSYLERHFPTVLEPFQALSDNLRCSFWPGLRLLQAKRRVSTNNTSTPHESWPAPLIDNLKQRRERKRKGKSKSRKQSCIIDT